MDPTFTDIYRAHYPAVLRFVRRRSPAPEVDDVVSETFLAAWRHQDDLAQAPLPWLYRTARNVLRNAARASDRREGLAVRIASVREAQPGIEDPFAHLDDHGGVADAWRRLDPLDQEVLALQAWEGLDGREAAAVLGISRAAYAMRLTRARRRLAGALDTTAAPAVTPLTPKEARS